MKSPAILILFVAIGLTFLKIKNLFIVDTKWIILLFALSLGVFYISVHRKNKENSTPRPVYFANPNQNSF